MIHTTRSTAVPPVRELLIQNRAYYVRTDGSDSNSGLADTAGDAWLTIQHAVDFISDNIDACGFTIRVKLGNGTYTDTIGLPTVVGAGTLVIESTTGTASAVIVTSTAGSTINVGSGCATPWTIQSFEVRAGGSSGDNCIFVQQSGVLNIGAGLRFGSTTGNHLTVYYGGTVFITDNYLVVGACSRHWFVQYASKLIASNINVTISGTPGMTAWATTALGGVIRATSFTYTGNITGSRYAISTGASIHTASATLTYFPGSSIGTNSASPNSGYYVST